MAIGQDAMLIAPRGDLRIPDAPERSRWDWGWLEGCFGNTKISPSDIDCIIERKGFFLALEVKRPDEALPTGQRLLLQRLADQPHFVVVLVYGQRNHPAYIHRVRRDGIDPEEPSSCEHFRAKVAAWFAWVDLFTVPF